MAEQIANDPSFQEVTKTLQETMKGMMDGAPGGMPGVPGMPGMPGGMPGLPEGSGGPAMDPREMMANMDPSKYMDAMQKMFTNPGFMNMAEKLGKTLIESDPNMGKVRLYALLHIRHMCMCMIPILHMGLCRACLLLVGPVEVCGTA